MGIVLLVLALVLPMGAIWATRNVPYLNQLSPIVLCYGIGILIGNIGLVKPLSPADDMAGLITTVTVAIAIPLLLFGTDFKGWLQNARPTLISFGLAIVSITIVAPIAANLFVDTGDSAGDVAAMTIGVYTGGTANMAAIGQAVGVPDATFVALNAADLVASAVYLLFLLSPATALLWKFLPRTPRLATAEEQAIELADEPQDDFDPAPTPGQVGRAFGLAVAVVLVGAGLAFAIVATLTDTEMILDSDAFATAAVLAVTTGGLAASFSRKVRDLPGTYPTGQYLFLVFAIAIGARANLSSLVSDLGEVLPFIIVALGGAIGLHFLLAAIFRIDRDTVLITSTAAVMGPPFVGPVASALGNREVVVAGMTTGVVGLALGNYLGLLVARVLG